MLIYTLHTISNNEIITLGASLKKSAVENSRLHFQKMHPDDVYVIREYEITNKFRDFIRQEVI